MRVISCLGSESSLLMCSHTPLGSTSFCNATNEVGVRCIGMFEVANFKSNHTSQSEFVNVFIHSFKPMACFFILL